MNSIDKKNIFLGRKLLVLIFTILVVGFFLVTMLGYIDFLYTFKNWLILLTFLFTGIYSTVSLANSVFRSGISLAVIHWFFISVFFFIVPLGQYAGDLFLFGSQITEENIISANLLIIIWCVTFSFAYRLAYREYQSRTQLFLSKVFICSIDRNRYRFYMLAFLSVLLASFFVYLAGGLQAFGTRASADAFLSATGWSRPQRLLFTHFLRPFSFWVFMFLLYILLRRLSVATKKPGRTVKRADIIWLLLACFSAIILNNPFSRARFYAFAIIFGVFVIFTYKKPNRNVIYILILFSGIILSRTINIYRDMAVLDVSKMSFEFSPRMLLHGDFDAYENFTHIISYIGSRGLAMGRQLLGALLFFVPRSIWDSKPVGSMWMVALETLPTERFNRAAPMISEWFINFHVVGVMFAAFLYGALSAVLDRRYHWSFSAFPDSGGKCDFYRILYPLLLGYFLFHLRGDFMSSYAYSMGCFLSFISVYLFIGKECCKS